jgi:hypothetical protein
MSHRAILISIGVALVVMGAGAGWYWFSLQSLSATEIADGDVTHPQIQVPPRQIPIPPSSEVTLSTHDSVFTTATPTFKGQARAAVAGDPVVLNVTITHNANGRVYKSEPIPVSDGRWSFTTPSLEDGVYTLELQVEGTEILSRTFGVLTQSKPIIDLRVNGSDGPITLEPGALVEVTWLTHPDFTYCYLAPLATGQERGNGQPVLLHTSLDHSGSMQGRIPVGEDRISLTCEKSGGPQTIDDVFIAGVERKPNTVDLEIQSPSGEWPDGEAWSDGPVTLKRGQAVTITWMAATATSCSLRGFGATPNSSGVVSNQPPASILVGVYPVAEPGSTTVNARVICTRDGEEFEDAIQITLVP